MRRLQDLISKEEQPLAFVGFDANVDAICLAVDTREDGEQFTAIDQIKDLGKRIHDSAERSCNVELVVQRTKIGGNAAILTDALLNLGQRVTYAGTIGTAEVERIFRPMAERCEAVYSLAPSGHTDAIEFCDGKVMLGKLTHYHEVNFQRLVDVVGKAALRELFTKIKLFASCNWTMLWGMNDIWRGIEEEILEEMPFKPWMFIDLADPRKRIDGDLKEAMFRLQKLSRFFRIVLGLNRHESRRVCSLQHSEIPEAPEERAFTLQEAYGFEQVVIHSRDLVVTATEEGIHEMGVEVCEEPKLTTGAGDHFNAGYCLALMHELSVSEALQLGVGIAGHYVRTGESPVLEQVFIDP